MIWSHPHLRRKIAEYLTLLMVHASHYRYRRFTFIVRNFFFEIFSILLGLQDLGWGRMPDKTYGQAERL